MAPVIHSHGGISINKLTVNDKIILHLLGYIKYKPQSEVPFAVTQQGIADAVEINLSHVPRAVKSLSTMKLLAELKAHVQTPPELTGSSTRKRKVYFLTDKGIRLGNRIRKQVEGHHITFIDRSGKSQTIKFDELVKKIQPSHILDLYNFIMIEGQGEKFELNAWLECQEPVDEKISVPYSVKYPRILSHIPKAGPLFGRDRDLESFNQILDSGDIKLFFIYGDRGLGKTALVSAGLTDRDRDTNIFWCECQTEDLYHDLLSQLSNLLSIAKRKSLNNYLMKTSDHNLEDGQLVEILRQDLQGVRTVIIMDGITDLAIKDGSFNRFLNFINLLLTGLPELKLIFTGRSLQPMIKKFETKPGSNRVKKLKVTGLDKKASKKILELGKTKIGAQEFEAIYHHTQGNPLFLEMITMIKLGPPPDQESYSAEEMALLKYLKVVETLDS